MSNWEVIKSLIRGTGVYVSQALFLIILVGVGLAIYFGWRAWGRPLAAVSLNEVPTDTIYYSGQKTMDIDVRGNGDIFIDGVKRNEALQFFEDNDELRVKVFDESGEFISSFKATVHLPSPVNQNQIRQIIYAVHGVDDHRAYMADSQTLIYEAQDISPSATFTIVAELPKGLITPNFTQQIKITVSHWPIKTWLYVAIFLPGLTLILMLFMVLKRRKANMLPIKGLLGGPPEELAPAIPGVLVDGVVGAREIAATLIDLAERGFIYIVNKGNGQFSFGIRRGGDIRLMTDLTEFEKDLLDKIFMPKEFKSTLSDVEMRIGHHIFSRKIAKVYLGIYNEATRQGLFVSNPAKIHLRWKFTGVTLFFASFLGFIIGTITEVDPKYGLFFWIGGMLAAYFMVKISPFMPARTGKGNQELREWLEFREYLVDKKPATGLMQMQNKFEEYLAYAIVLGAEVDWANRFAQARFNKPDWYESPEPAVTLESFAGQFYPLIGYVAEHLARSHEPTVE